MASTEALSNLGRANPFPVDVTAEVEPGDSAVSWGAIIAGAAAAAAVSMILLALGMGLGLSAISPWSQKGVHAATFGFASIVWVTVTQICASALGGYLAGRLRMRWTSLHSDEVYFRDTAHGLLSWAVASLVSAAMLVSFATSAVGTAAQATATLAAGVTAANVTATTSTVESGDGSMGYLVDSLLRKDSTASSLITNSDPYHAPVAEVTRIFLNSAGAANLPQQDIRYLGQLVVQRTGLSQVDAERRVADTYGALQTSINNAKSAAISAADKARKVAIQASLWIFIGLLAGAFIASFTATIGGRERDA